MSTAKKKKRITILVIVAVLLSAILLAAVMLGGKKTPVEVERASNWMLGWMPNQMQLYGSISSDRSQQILYNKDMTVLEVLVKEGDTVKVGDPLLRYDATLDTIDLELKELEMQKLQYELADYYKEYKRYAREEYPRTIPSPTPTPSPTPRPTRTSKPTRTPKAAETPKQAASSGTMQMESRVFRPANLPAILLRLFNSTLLPDLEIREDKTAFSAGELIGYLEQSFRNGTAYDVRVSGTDYVLLLSCSMTQNMTLTADALEYTGISLSAPNIGSGTQADPYTLSDFAPGGLIRGLGTSFFQAALQKAEKEPCHIVLTNGGSIRIELTVTDTDVPTPTPTAEPSATPTPTPTPSPTPTASPSPSPSASPDGSTGIIIGGGSSGGSGLSREERQALAKQYAKKIRDAELEYKQLKLDLQNLRLRGADGYLRAEIDGIVSLAADPATLSHGERLIAIKGSEGFYVRCVVGELDLDRVPVGTELSGFCYENGQSCIGKVVEIGTVPITENYYSGGNSNVSGYAIRIFIENGQGLQAGQYVEFTLGTSPHDSMTELSEPQDVYLYEAYVREIDGLHYIYVVRDGVLRKEQVERGRMQYSYVELVGSTLTNEDYIAFPYGKDVKDGAPVILPDGEELMG